jgi:hypothetical protein
MAAGNPDVLGFLNKLATDDAFERKFDTRPLAAMDEFYLDDRQKALILGGTLQQIRGMIDEASEGVDTPNVIMIKMRI